MHTWSDNDQIELGATTIWTGDIGGIRSYKPETDPYLM